MAKPVPIDAYSLDAATRDVNGLRLFRGAFPPDVALPAHHHDAASVFVTLDGGLVECYRAGARECEAGTLLFKPAGERHSNRFSAAGARVIAVELGDERVAPAALGIPEAIVHRRDARATALAARLAGEMRAHDAAAPLALEGLALELVAHALRLAPVERAAGGAPPWLARVRDRLMDHRLDVPPPLAAIATEAGRHPVYLARAFRRHYGCSVGAYVRRARLDWAAERLAGTAEALSEIALRAGFSDQSHFSRLFRAHTGHTPRGYRDLVRAGSTRPR